MIRKATSTDIPYIVDMTMKGVREMGYTPKESLVVNKVVLSYHTAPCFLLVKDDNICGMVGLTIVTSSLTGDAMLSEYMIYLEKDHRNLKNLSALVGASKDFALSSCLPLKFEFANKFPLRVMERLFLMHGFEINGLNGVYNG